MPIKKGDLVRLLREKFENSVEALASDRRLPPYVFDGTGEVVDLSGNYAQIKFLVPTSTVWLAVEQLESVK